jgi:hypothetical protein
MAAPPAAADHGVSWERARAPPNLSSAECSGRLARSRHTPAIDPERLAEQGADDQADQQSDPQMGGDREKHEVDPDSAGVEDAE